MSPKNEERRYDNVQITNIVDGTVIEGHDAVKAYLEREQELVAEHGASIFFQVYRLNLQADTLEELQGAKLAEIKVDGSFATSTDTVGVIKDKVRSLLGERAGQGDGDQPLATLNVEDSDRITFYLSGRPMQDHMEFYADNYIMLPVWIQVLLHSCESEEAVRLINQFQQ